MNSNLPIRVFEGPFGRLSLIEAAAGTAPHTHKDPRMCFLHKGPECHYMVAGERVAISRDVVAFINSDELHANVGNAGDSVPQLLVFECALEWLQKRFPAAVEAGGTRVFARPLEAITPRIRRLADTLAVEVMNDRFLSGERLEFMLQELLLSIIDSYLARRRSSPFWRGSRFEDSRIRRAIALLRARPNKELNMDEIASQVGLSRSRFYDLFQLCTGLSPRAYLDMLCVETAIARLSTDGSRIGDVSAELGFSAQSNFTRFFLHQIGVAPSAYRRAVARPGAEVADDALSGVSKIGR